MQDVLQKISEVLKELLDCCNEMFRLSEEECKVLKTDDMQKLLGINEKMTEYAIRLSQLEQKRAELHSRAVRKLGLPMGCGLREFLSGARSMESLDAQADLLNEIEATADSLSKTYKDLRDQNELNQMMVRQSMGYIDKLMEALLPEYKLTYKKGGEIFQNGIPSSFVNETV